jgi:aspartate/methionine/tyrosine aminotransferase
MRIDLFRMERTQCLYEHAVEYNLSESGVEPLRLEEVLAGDAVDDFMMSRLAYPPSDGSPALRERIGMFYGARPDEVLVTNGGSEANHLAVWGMLDSSGAVAVMLPNYLQTWGLGRAFGARADAFRLVVRREGGARRWALDVESLRRAVTAKTRLIVVTNPNNPTGAVLNESEMDAIVDTARKVGAWLLVDEIYRGAETPAAAALTPTFWGRYKKLIVTSGLSKAFGMPGLRLGWVVAPRQTIAHLCRYRDYTTLTPSTLSDRLASIVMEPARREAVLSRTRGIIKANLPRLEQWIETHREIFTYVPPVAGAIAFIAYRLPISSTALFDAAREQQSVLITPGSHFGVGKYFRVGYGYDIGRTLEGLARFDVILKKCKAHRRAA